MGQKYGQHFLHDQDVLGRIEHEIDIFSPATVIEIGPGRGVLTRRLLDKPYTLFLSEIDISLQPVLDKLTRRTEARIIRGDILEQPVKNEWSKLLFWEYQFEAATTIVVGNLPYYITSPILRKFFFDLCALPGGVFLVQKEVADKIRYDAPKKSYLRRLLNLSYEVTYVCTVKAGSFTPPPKVLSAVIILTRLASARLENVQIPHLLSFLELASPFKRKTLWKIRKMQVEKFEQAELSIPDYLLGKRLEELGREEMKIIVSS